MCIESNTHITDVSPFNLLPASGCNFKCGDDIYLGDCGGESAYNIYETQKGISWRNSESFFEYY